MGIISAMKAKRAVKKEAVRPYTDEIKSHVAKGGSRKTISVIKPKGARINELKAELIDHRSMPISITRIPITPAAEKELATLEVTGRKVTKEAKKVLDYAMQNPKQTRYKILPVDLKPENKMITSIGNFAIIDTEKGNKPIGFVYKKGEK